MARTYSESELQNFQAAEKELRAIGLVSDEVDGATEMQHNSERILAYFESNPQIPATVQTILAACEQMKDQLHWLSQAEMAYNAAYRSLSKAEQEQFGAWWFTSGKKYVETDREHGFENATKIINWCKGRTFSNATFDLAVSNLASSKGLHFQTVKAQPNPRKHADSGSFMPKQDTNLSARDHARKAQQARAAGTPAQPTPDSTPDAWSKIIEGQLAEGTHSQQAASKQLYARLSAERLSPRQISAELQKLQRSYKRLFSPRAV